MTLAAWIPPRLLRLDEQSGRLFWRERTAGLASLSGCVNPTKAANIFNTQFAGKEALTAVAANGYRIGAIFDKLVIAHRVVWLMVHGDWPSMQVDHINGIRTDNRPENLRLVTQSQNNANSRSRAGTSRFKGVSWAANLNKWCVQITRADPPLKVVQYFADEEEAARFYDAMAVNVFGDFARTNQSLNLFSEKASA